MRSKKQILASIKTVCTSAARLQVRIHEIALECLQHAQEHGDATLINTLYRGLPTGQRTESLRVWVETYSPIRFKSDGGVGVLKAEAKAFTPYDLVNAETNPYYTERETVKKPLTLDQLIKLANGMVNKVNKAEEEGRIAEGEDPAKMKAFAAAIAAAAKAEAANTLPA